MRTLLSVTLYVTAFGLLFFFQLVYEHVFDEIVCLFVMFKVKTKIIKIWVGRARENLA